MDMNESILQSWGVVYRQQQDRQSDEVPFPNMYLTDYKGNIWIDNEKQLKLTNADPKIKDIITGIRSKKLFKIEYTENDLFPKILISPKTKGVFVDGRPLTGHHQVRNGRCHISVEGLSFVFEAFYDETQSDKLAELREYRVTSQLGEGAYSSVYRALHIPTENFHAVKAEENVKKCKLPFEYKLLHPLHNDHVIRCHELITHKRHVFMSMDVADGGSLRHCIKRVAPLGEAAARHIFGQVLSGVEFLHSSNIVHRDLKPANVVLSGGEVNCAHVRIIDFGLSCHGTDDSRMKRVVGTVKYMAPELLYNYVYEKKKRYTEKVDEWSVGLCLYLSMIGEHPVGFNGNVELYHKRISSLRVNKIQDPRYTRLTDECRKVIESCLSMNVEERANATLLLECDWFHPDSRPILQREESLPALEEENSLTEEQ